MQKLIASKIEEYKSLRSDNKELRAWLRDSDLWYWLYGVLRVTGSPLRRDQIVTVLSGEIDENLPVDVYNVIHRMAAIYKDMLSDIEMQATPDRKMMGKWYCMLTGSDVPAWRKDNAVVYQWGFVPPHFNEINELSDRLFKAIPHLKAENGFIYNAVMPCLEFLKIYPFGEETLSMGLLLLMYQLLAAGCPLPALTASEQECNEFIGKYVDGSDPQPFTEMVERSVLNRLEGVIAICRQASEVQ